MAVLTVQKLPKVLASSVIRCAQPGDAHGGLYLVDLENGSSEQILNWDTTNISFRDRGAERGLRGISVWRDNVFVCTVDRILVYDRDFNQIDEIANAYFGDLHETMLDGDILWVSSSLYDSLIAVDLNTGRCVKGICLRNDVDRVIKKQLWKILGIKAPAGAKLSFFDPEKDGGPRSDDVIHLNTVSNGGGGTLLAAAHRGVWLYAIENGRLSRRCRIPKGAHNAQPFRDGYIISDTVGSRVLRLDGAGKIVQSYETVSYPKSDLINGDLEDEIAKTGFARGLCSYEDRVLIAGCSPATVHAFDADSGEMLKSINLSMDVRNAIHGLEVYPF